jgi:hypothetical protein
MLEIASELAQRVILTWPTPSTIARAVEPVAIGARRSGQEVAAVDVASLIPCAVADNCRHGAQCDAAGGQVSSQQEQAFRGRGSRTAFG